MNNCSPLIQSSMLYARQSVRDNSAAVGHVLLSFACFFLWLNQVLFRIVINIVGYTKSVHILWWASAVNLCPHCHVCFICACACFSCHWRLLRRNVRGSSWTVSVATNRVCVCKHVGRSVSWLLGKLFERSTIFVFEEREVWRSMVPQRWLIISQWAFCVQELLIS